MSPKYKLRYEVLKLLGHAPAKAAEIALDCQRRVPWARSWMASMWRIRRIQLAEVV